MSRTKKQPYRKARRWFASCRNHGSCSWCRDNRTHASVKAQRVAAEKQREAAREMAADMRGEIEG